MTGSMVPIAKWGPAFLAGAGAAYAISAAMANRGHKVRSARRAGLALWWEGLPTPRCPLCCPQNLPRSVTDPAWGLATLEMFKAAPRVAGESPPIGQRRGGSGGTAPAHVHPSPLAAHPPPPPPCTGEPIKLNPLSS